MQARFPKERILDAYNAAPALVRKTYNADETQASIARLQERYALHVDVIGSLDSEFKYLLLGLVSPLEFNNHLVMMGIPVESVSKILADLNQEVFIPLQKKIRERTPEEVAADIQPFTQELASPEAVATDTQVAFRTRSEPVQVPIMQVAAQAAPLTSAPTPPSPPAQAVSAPVPTIPEPVQAATPTYNLIRPETVQAQPVMRTMAHDMEALSQQHAPITAQSPQPFHQTIQPEHVTPARSFQTASVPMEFSAPTIRPVTPSQPVQTLTQPAKEYGADPYRESFA